MEINILLGLIINFVLLHLLYKMLYKNCAFQIKMSLLCGFITIYSMYNYVKQTIRNYSLLHVIQSRKGL